MSTKRRIGVSIASTEAARRQLMQPVPCWEKVWVPADNGGGSNLKIYKWVKTEKIQQFSDDEGEVDEPLAPLPDEPEVIDGDEEDEALPENVVEETQATEIIDATQDEESKPPSPKPQLSMSLQDNSELDALDTSLKPMDEDLGVTLGMNDQSISGDGMELDMSGLGPDGLGLEDSHDLSQLGGVDVLVGGQTMDASADPFGHVVEE
ncbi:hypothetical protein H0H92_000152 [Tricholoma furcatifolium]|nr:hypothetical protein H0H92_000152 [Tricholoma furcatifolium]